MIYIYDDRTNQTLTRIDWLNSSSTVGDLYQAVKSRLNITDDKYFTPKYMELSYLGTVIDRVQCFYERLEHLTPAIHFRGDGDIRIYLSTFKIKQSPWFKPYGGFAIEQPTVEWGLDENGQLVAFASEEPTRVGPTPLEWNLYKDGKLTAIRTTSGAEISGTLELQINGTWKYFGNKEIRVHSSDSRNNAKPVTLNFKNGECINKVVIVAHDRGRFGLGLMEFFTNKGRSVKVGNTEVSGSDCVVSSGYELIGMQFQTSCWSEGIQFKWRSDIFDDKIRQNDADWQPYSALTQPRTLIKCIIC